MKYRHGLMLALIAGAMAMSAEVKVHAAEMRIKPAESRMITIAGEPRTIIISRPEVINVRIMSGNKLMIQGIANGDTRVEVLDSDGRKLANLDVIVSDARDRRTVRMYLAGRRSTYSCAPNCVKVFVPNDDSKALADAAHSHGLVQGFYAGVVGQTGDFVPTGKRERPPVED